MALIRRRYYIWLIRAYIKRWYKAIITSIIFGGVVFFVLAAIANFYFLPLIQKKVQKIGYIGVYSLNNIPSSILSDVSYGLTSIDKSGQVKPAASYKWEVRKGKEYIFYIKHGQFFHDGSELDTTTLPLTFKDATRKNIDKYTVSFTLSSPYSPFLVSVSKPIITNNLSGLGKYKIDKIDVNGGFVRSLVIENIKDTGSKKIILFYPTEDALKDAYALGDIDIADGLTSTFVKGSDFSSWKNTKVISKTNYSQLVTIFYNTEDSNLSNKKLRQALSYAVPDKFEDGLRAYSPIVPTSIYFSEPPNYGISSIEISKNLLEGDSDSKKAIYEISTTAEYLNIARLVSDSWKKIGIHTKIKVVTEFPRNFQILIYAIRLPQDPDQYTLWHSTGINNIARYKTNKRIDKLLEDGRSIDDVQQRISIYADFQKYLIDDAPATFLYYPKIYTTIRK